MSAVAVKIEVRTPDFFAIPPKRITIEEVPETGRTYFLLNDRIVAVGRLAETPVQQPDLTI